MLAYQSLLLTVCPYFIWPLVGLYNLVIFSFFLLQWDVTFSHQLKNNFSLYLLSWLSKRIFSLRICFSFWFLNVLRQTAFTWTIILGYCACLWHQFLPLPLCCFKISLKIVVGLGPCIETHIDLNKYIFVITLHVLPPRFKCFQLIFFLWKNPARADAWLDACASPPYEIVHSMHSRLSHISEGTTKTCTLYDTLKITI